ncbi:hypothetical protein GCM10020001_009940 [Nonomuraea salmonea]
MSEEARLKYRYLDIRRQQVANAMRTRSKATYLANEVMHELGFVYVETPTLTRSTPEGARDFLVPVRLQPGNWYALPQSPQLFKQLLQVAGLERYYQLAKCYRDEDLRADRQPEFTQIDVEMSFVDQEDVIEVGEKLIGRLWKEIAGYELPTPLPRMTYADAMARYGSDKPDLRFGQELVEMTDYFSGTSFRVFQADYVGAVVMPGGASQTRKELDGWQEWARSRGAKGLAYVLVQEDGTLGGPVAKNLSEQELSGLAGKVGAQPGDAIFFAAGAKSAARDLLGAARLEIGRRCDLIDESQWSFLWVVDAPMFEEDGEGGWTAVHHPFTGPKPEWADNFQDHPGEALAYAYDMVCNGMEIGGGSIRIHRAEMQQRVFDVLGISKEDAESKFGFLLEAFKYGPPPARRHRLRLGPHLHAAVGRRLDPRRDRVPEDGLRLRPADRRAHADHDGAAQGGGRGRRAQAGVVPRMRTARAPREGGARAVLTSGRGAARQEKVMRLMMTGLRGAVVPPSPVMSASLTMRSLGLVARPSSISMPSLTMPTTE